MTTSSTELRRALALCLPPPQPPARRRARRSRSSQLALLLSFAAVISIFMINYRVDDLSALLAQLKSNGVEIVKRPDSDENGKFAWVMDPDGNKVELWEPKISNEKNKKA